MMDYGRPHSNQSHDMAASFDSTRHRRLKRMQQACSKEDVECLCRTDTDGIGLTRILSPCGEPSDYSEESRG